MSLMGRDGIDHGAWPDVGQALLLYSKRIVRYEILKKLKEKTSYIITINYSIECESMLVEMAKSKAMEAILVSNLDKEHALDIVKFLSMEYLKSSSIPEIEKEEISKMISSFDAKNLFERII